MIFHTDDDLVLFNKIKKDKGNVIYYQLSCYFVRAKLYPIERTVGSIRCTKRGCVCENVNITDIQKQSSIGVL